jgi:ubiquitin-protein ligase E3 C
MKVILVELFRHILSIPLLLNRLPLLSITKLSAAIPYSHLDALELTFIPLLPHESQANLLANISTIVAARYTQLSRPSLKVYLELLQRLMIGIPRSSLKFEGQEIWVGSYLDDDSDDETVFPAAEITGFPAELRLDSRTTSRINSLRNRAHLQPLLTAASQSPSLTPSLVTFCLGLCELWPAEREYSLGACIICLGSTFIRQIYREYVRTSPLGRKIQVNYSGTFTVYML